MPNACTIRSVEYPKCSKVPNFRRHRAEQGFDSDWARRGLCQSARNHAPCTGAIRCFPALPIGASSAALLTTTFLSRVPADESDPDVVRFERNRQNVTEVDSAVAGLWTILTKIADESPDPDVIRTLNRCSGLVTIVTEAETDNPDPDLLRSIGRLDDAAIGPVNIMQ